VKRQKRSEVDLKMTRFFVSTVTLFILLSASAQSIQSKSISYIEMTSTWIHIYDERGKVYYTDTRSRFGDVVGYSSTFFIIKRGSFYVLYDTAIRPLKTMSISNVGEILSVTGDSFTARKGSFVTTYDKTGKSLRTRTVP
jgi:hypothetical protein